ncbi:MAG: glycosyltransferase family 2 protein [Candidatus Yanofskybacteria bacterium]|nr:glycosyltransferase family 2 protein [Candidatus Yanofskybacteria bacterium]
MYISVIIPAYNEEKRIEKTLLSVHEYLSRQSYDYEIIVVSDGSKDNTVGVVSNLKSTYPDEVAASATKAGQIPNLKIIDDKENHGKGWAVRRGMLEAQGDYRLFMDADNSTTIDQIENFLPYFSQGSDIVIGSRRIAGADIAVKQPWIRDFLGGIFRLIVHTLVPLGVKDSQAGFKCFSRKATEAVFQKQTIFRWAFDVEILAIALKLGFKIEEAPIRWVNDTESKVKLSGMIKMLFEVLQVRWNLWTYKYSA